MLSKLLKKFFSILFYSNLYAQVFASANQVLDLNNSLQTLSSSEKILKTKVKLLASDNKNPETEFREYQVGCVKIRLQMGDMLTFKADAIVNAANKGCLGGGGLDGQITSKGGKALAKARENIPVVDGIRCPETQARITLGGKLPFAYILHATAPDCSGTSDKKELNNKYNQTVTTYINTISRAAAFNNNPKDKNYIEFAFVDIDKIKKFKSDHKITSISFPTLGSGIFQCNASIVAEKLIPEIKDYFEKNCSTGIEQINFMFFEPGDPAKAKKEFEVYKDILDKLIKS